VVSDTHLGHVQQQITALRRFYSIAADEGCERVFHCGDLVDGIKMRGSQQFETFLQGADEYMQYVIENYPADLPTWVIGGNHDESFVKHGGLNIVKQICREREDMKYLGMHEAYVNYNNTRIAMFHGSGGKQAAARLNQLFSRACHVGKRPDLILSGHLHYFTVVPFIENTSTIAIQTAGFQGMTNYLKRTFKNPVVGGLIVWPNSEGLNYQPIAVKQKKRDYAGYKERSEEL
jgi:predicted phosphodiesterase